MCVINLLIVINLVELDKRNVRFKPLEYVLILVRVSKIGVAQLVSIYFVNQFKYHN